MIDEFFQNKEWEKLYIAMGSWMSCAVGEKLNLKGARIDEETVSSLLFEHDRELMALGTRAADLACYIYCDGVQDGEPSVEEVATLEQIITQIRQHEPNHTLLLKLQKWGNEIE